MVLDWLLFGLLVFGVAKLLNATAFKVKPASPPVAWGLTITVFFINLVVLSILKAYRYQAVSDMVGGRISPKHPFDWVGAFVFTSLFFSFLRREKKKQMPPSPQKEEATKPEPQPLTQINPHGNNPHSAIQPIAQPHPTAGPSLNEENKKCRYCGEIIKLEAKKCRFCGKIFDEKEVEREIEEQHMGIFIENETKNCPMCAEAIKLDSKKCELCGEMFDPEEVQRQVEERRFELLAARKGLKRCPSCGTWDVYRAFIEDGGQGDWCPNCKKSLWKMAKENPTHPTTGPSPHCPKVDQMSRATMLKEAQDWPRLLAWSSQLTQTEPENYFAWSTIGFVYGKMRRYKEAVDAYREALRLKPDNAEDWGNLGIAYITLGRHNEEGLQACREALRLEPDNAGAWKVLGNAFKILGRYREATEAWQEVIRLEPDSAEAWYDIALTYAQTGNPSAALEAVKELRRYDPKKAEELSKQIVKQRGKGDSP
jgi:cytochrome c-type biogenesis protein CcmH/NrfG